MKTKEELNAIKEEVETLNKKLAELSEEELKQVTGGTQNPYDNYFSKDSVSDPDTIYENHIYTKETEEEAKRKFFGK